MRWYGFTKLAVIRKTFIPNFRRRVNLRARTLVLNLTTKATYRVFPISIYLPSNWKVMHLQNMNYPTMLILNLTSIDHYSNIVIPTTFVKYTYDPHVRSLNLVFEYYNNYYNLYWFTFFLVFNSITSAFFNKIKFRGKGYYVYKNYRNAISFQFGFSHRVKIYLYFVNVKKLTKTSVLMFGLNKFDIIKAGHMFTDKRPINIFTGRGARFTRQIIYRKSGKISSYR